MLDGLQTLVLLLLLLLSSMLAKMGSGFKPARNTPTVLDSWLAGGESNRESTYFGPEEEEFPVSILPYHFCKSPTLCRSKIAHHFCKNPSL
jgi:hypothetical protein